MTFSHRWLLLLISDASQSPTPIPDAKTSRVTSSQGFGSKGQANNRVQSRSRYRPGSLRANTAPATASGSVPRVLFQVQKLALGKASSQRILFGFLAVSRDIRLIPVSRVRSA